MTDRDHFAAAALTGLLAQGDDGSFSEESYARGAYRWADAMLRCRGGVDYPLPDNAPNLDAAPVAIASEATASPERVRVRGDAGTGDTPVPVAWATFHGTAHCVAEPLYRRPQPTLTDAEREALHWFSHYGLPEPKAAALRGLLERLGGGR